MHHIEGQDRDQLTLFPEVMDDYISPDNPVRFLDVFIETMDFETLGLKNATLKDTGRPPYHPGDLLRIYIYGYLNSVRSRRMLERRNYIKRQLQRVIRDLDKKIESYPEELDEVDEQKGEVPRPTEEELHEKIEKMRSRQDNVKELTK